MRFAIVGECPEAVFTVEAIHASEQHQIGTACVSGNLAATMSARGISFSLVSSPEEAISDPTCDAVLIAVTDVDQSMAMARQASQAGCHVVVVPPQDVSTAYSFELHLLLDESQKGIVPLAGRWYVADASQISASETNIQQIKLSFPLIADALAESQLRGIDALCGCGHEFTQVTALDVPGADGQMFSRSITLASSGTSQQHAPPATLSFDNDAADEMAFILVKQQNGETLTLTTALPNPVACHNIAFQKQVLDSVAARLVDPIACQQGMEEFSNTLELMEGLAKSLRRRRTIDVHFDGVSERSAFKTQMTAIGCGVLTYLLFGLVAFLVIAKVATLPPWALQLGRILWISPLVLFLFAQFLLPLARERSSKTDRV